jgi:hypothetical protein
MESATIVILPVGDFTAAMARQITDALGEAAATGRAIVISMEWTTRCFWDALCELVAALRGPYRDVTVGFASVPPARRALLRELGLEPVCVAEGTLPATTRRILVWA